MIIILKTIMRLFCFFKKENEENEENENTPIHPTTTHPIPSTSKTLFQKNERKYKECKECKRKINKEDTIYFGMDKKFCSDECRSNFMVNIV